MRATDRGLQYDNPDLSEKKNPQKNNHGEVNTAIFMVLAAILHICWGSCHFAAPYNQSQTEVYLTHIFVHLWIGSKIETSGWDRRSEGSSFPETFVEFQGHTTDPKISFQRSLFHRFQCDDGVASGGFQSLI